MYPSLADLVNWGQAHVTSMLYNINRRKGKQAATVQDFLLRFRPKTITKQPQNVIKTKLRSWLAMMRTLGRVKDGKRSPSP